MLELNELECSLIGGGETIGGCVDPNPINLPGYPTPGNPFPPTLPEDILG